MRWHPLGTGLISLQGCEAGERLRRRAALLACGSPSPRQEFVAAIVRPEIDEADENIGQIGLGLDAVQFTGLYQRSQDRPIFGAVIMTREESILAGKGLRAHRTLDDVGVELDAAIVKKAGEAVPVPEAVADDPGRIRAAREPRELMLEEDLERIDERARSCRDYQEFRARGRFSSLADEPFAEDDGELGLGLEPFARRPFPFVSRVVQNQV